MSLFLGKIHFWLYNKILWAEKIEESIIEWAGGKGMPVDRWIAENNEKFGASMGKEPLENIIDTSNIHGWLQTRIESAELRQAALVTGILEQSSAYKDELLGLYREQGEKAAAQYPEKPDTPEEVFNALNDFILEGMPCDRVNEVAVSSEYEFVWRTTTCLHTPYWERVKGDIRHFYELRKAWVAAFVGAVSPGFKYSSPSEGLHRIEKLQAAQPEKRSECPGI
ncbi:hypothetical protein CLHUN_11490 [Ruminiclostridium hungatei]|uniref:Uncharacterized protein n=1 Tax=Ruminiclostridium hungatei TaxID=48256 RepID=A0A1V4SNV6_RUMHU|nr:hypothetical protein [Ruminiclostridium hungatei]OPX44917.1 hypothetical protein CLHUN_11490 [Ruminiclostridium hungatei]